MPRFLHIAVSMTILLMWAHSGHAATAERIVDFHSLVEISADGTLQVTETIRVIAAGQAIKRGIFRDFPTRYKRPDGSTARVDFRVIAVLRDGHPEPFHLKNTANGKRVYIGKKDVLLAPGDHTFTLAYLTDRQLGYFEDFDELYWNVTGNDWQFPIDRVRAVIRLPAGAETLRAAAYTGGRGESGQNFDLEADELGDPLFSTTRPLKPGEGLTVAVAWPKGFVDEPTAREKFGFFVRDQAGFFTGLTAIAFILGYYAFIWLRIGKDPDRGIIVARFRPPEGLSPAAVRYVMQMGYDNTAFAAALVNIAVKGVARIVQAEDDGYILEKTGTDTANLSRNERKIYRTLLGPRMRIELEKKNRRILRKAVSALKTALDTEYQTVMFKRNSGYLIPGAIITVLGLAAVVLTAREVAPAAFMCVWLTFWSAGCTVMAARVIAAWRGIMGRRKLGAPLQLAGALVITLFSAPFFGGWIMGFFMFARTLSPLAALLVLVMILINGLFYHLLKAPTREGRRLMDEIEGFARYLSVAEKDRLNLLNPPHKTPQLFEKYLPFAMALDVEQQWGEQFAQVLSGVQRDPGRPVPWYHGNPGRPMGAEALASSLSGSLAGAISSASAAPGSSSGSGGGGSSGGGGGGGGGGGW